MMSAHRNNYGIFHVPRHLHPHGDILPLPTTVGEALLAVDYGGFEACINMFAGQLKTIVVTYPVVLESNVTLSENAHLAFTPSGSIDTNGHTLTVDSPSHVLASPAQRIFKGTVLSSYQNGVAWVEWFGPDGVSDEDSINQALVFANHVRFQKDLYINGPIDISKSYVTFEGDREGLKLIPSHVAGNVVYIFHAATLMDITLRQFRIVPTTEKAANTLVGIHNNNGRRVKLSNIEVKNCGLYGIYSNLHSMSIEDCVAWYCATGLYNDEGSNVLRVRGSYFTNNDTGIHMRGGAYLDVQGSCIEVNTVGVSIEDGVAGPCYSPRIESYFESNGTDVVIDGNSNYVVNPIIKGYCQRSASANPSITMTYARDVHLEDYAVNGSLHGIIDPKFTIGVAVEGLSLRNVSDEYYGSVASNGVVTESGVVDIVNRVLNGAFDTWTAGDALAPDNWTLSIHQSVAKISDDKRDGNFICQLTADTAAGGYLYQNVPVPPACRLAGMPFVLIGDTLWVSGGGAQMYAVPQDDAGVTQGKTCTGQLCTGAGWWVNKVRPGYLATSTTRIQVRLAADMVGSTGVGRFARIGVYFGSTPWGFMRNPVDP